MQGNNITIFIPSSFIQETKDLKLKTYKVGLIGRSAALFRVTKIVVYSDTEDPEDRKGVKFISDILHLYEYPTIP
jgi:predicted SPOUT superfamily RNA methylase MTH1